MEDDFVQELHSLVDKALAPEQEHLVSLTYADSQILKVLDSALSKYLSEQDIIEIYHQLRSSITPTIFNKRDLYTAVKKCKTCLTVEGKPHLLIGSSNPEILFILENPNEIESGTELVDLSSLTKNKCALTFLARCIPQIRTSKEHIKSCSSFLSSEIDGLAPKKIILVGANVSKAILGEQFKITSDHGKVFNIDNYSVIPIYNLDFAKNDDRRFKELKEDLKKL